MCIHIIPRKRGTHLDMCAAYCENNGMKSVSFQHKHGRIARHVQIVSGMHRADHEGYTVHRTHAYLVSITCEYMATICGKKKHEDFDEFFVP